MSTSELPKESIELAKFINSADFINLSSLNSILAITKQGEKFIETDFKENALPYFNRALILISSFDFSINHISIQFTLEQLFSTIDAIISSLILIWNHNPDSFASNMSFSTIEPFCHTEPIAMKCSLLIKYARFQMETGDESCAIEYIDNAIKTAINCKEDYKSILSLCDIVDILKQWGHTDKAKELLELSVSIARNKKASLFEVLEIHTRLLDVNEYIKADEIMQKIELTAIDTSNFERKYFYLNQIAKHYDMIGKASDAHRVFIMALETALQAKQQGRAVHDEFGLVCSLSKTKDYKNALKAAGLIKIYSLIVLSISNILNALSLESDIKLKSEVINELRMFTGNIKNAECKRQALQAIDEKYQTLLG